MAEPIKNLAWDDFWLVNAIADARSLPGAAVLLGINHSTVFRRLGQIEEALGVTLFERHRSGYALTPAGEAMVALAQQINENITSFTRKIAGTGDRARGRAASYDQRFSAHPPVDTGVRRLPPAMPRGAPRRGAGQSGAELVEARRRRGNPGDRQTTGEPGRTACRHHRLGTLWPRQRVPGPRNHRSGEPFRVRLGLARRQLGDAEGGEVRAASTCRRSASSTG